MIDKDIHFLFFCRVQGTLQYHQVECIWGILFSFFQHSQILWQYRFTSYNYEYSCTKVARKLLVKHHIKFSNSVLFDHKTLNTLYTIVWKSLMLSLDTGYGVHFGFQLGFQIYKGQ